MIFSKFQEFTSNQNQFYGSLVRVLTITPLDYSNYISYINTIRIMEVDAWFIVPLELDIYMRLSVSLQNSLNKYPEI